MPPKESITLDLDETKTDTTTMILNDQSYYSMLFPKGHQKTKSVLKEKRNISIVLISAACLLGALLGGLAIGVGIENSRVAICSNHISNSSTNKQSLEPSWMCPARLTPIPQNTSTTAVVTRDRHPLSVIKPVVIEIGIFALFQAVGLRFFKMTSSLVAKRLPRLLSRVKPLAKFSRSLAELIAATRRVMQKSAGGLYKATKLFYKKAAASKVVTRTKKMVKTLLKKKKYADKKDGEKDH
ncbi:hypothetical protein ACA910_004068 [Epithemia clementina (nom. ined.)]